MSAELRWLGVLGLLRCALAWARRVRSCTSARARRCTWHRSCSCATTAWSLTWCAPVRPTSAASPGPHVPDELQSRSCAATAWSPTWCAPVHPSSAASPAPHVPGELSFGEPLLWGPVCCLRHACGWWRRTLMLSHVPQRKLGDFLGLAGATCRHRQHGSRGRAAFSHGR